MTGRQARTALQRAPEGDPVEAGGREGEAEIDEREYEREERVLFLRKHPGEDQVRAREADPEAV